MTTMANTLKAQYDLANDAFKNAHVVAPYVNGPKPVSAPDDGKAWLRPDTWKEDRKTWLKSSFQVAALSSAAQAAGHMQAVWEDILEGRNDLSSVTAFLQDVRDFTDAAASFNTAEQTRKANP